MFKSLFKCCFILFLICNIISCGSGGGNSGDSVEPVEPEKPTTRLLNPILENTVPMGLSSFAMGVSNKFPLEDAQQTPEGIGYKTVARSVRHIATNELYTFVEKDSSQQIYDTLKFFIDSGHAVTHEIHILNGPSMRSSRDKWINGVYGYHVDDDKFVGDLLYNTTVQNAVKGLFAEVVTYARSLELLGVEVIICPELEDNHSADREYEDGRLTTYGFLIKVLTDLGWARGQIVRNGGRLFAIPDIRYEVHNDASIGVLRPGDIFNMDGKSFSFGPETQKPYFYSEDHVRYMRNTTQDRGVIFYIWHHKLQGYCDTGNNTGTPCPSYTSRDYVLKYPLREISILLNIKPEEVLVSADPVTVEPRATDNTEALVNNVSSGEAEVDGITVSNDPVEDNNISSDVNSNQEATGSNSDIETGEVKPPAMTVYIKPCSNNRIPWFNGSNDDEEQKYCFYLADGTEIDLVFAN